MSCHLGNCGIAVQQGDNEKIERADLFGCAGVLIVSLFALANQATCIADTDGISVVAVAVRALFPKRATSFYRPIQLDEEMVPNAVPFLLEVPFVDICGGYVLVGAGFRAVDDNFIDHARGMCLAIRIGR